MPKLTSLSCLLWLRNQIKRILASLINHRIDNYLIHNKLPLVNLYLLLGNFTVYNLKWTNR